MRGLVILLLSLSMSGCEGFKVLILRNCSPDHATVTIKPGIEKFDNHNLTRYPLGNDRDSTVVTLAPDSAVVLISIFTTMMYGSKIKAYDLRIHYLRIETRRDTIVADTKEKIIGLLTDARTRYRKTDKPLTNAKNFGNIMIR